MLTNQHIQTAIDNCLRNTDFLNLANRRKGKVRDIFDLGETLLLITTDRLSAFDRILATIPFKGQVLNQVSAFWFRETQDIVPNHVVSLPDPNITIARKCRLLPIEFVVRGYLTGSTDTSAWTLYARGERTICGNTLPNRMVKNQRFEQPILTPTTKSDVHDESISVAEISSRGIIEQPLLEEVCRIALNLFKRGQEIALKNGLVLVDTKYEFGLDADGNLTLIDEIHTPDSSRYWIAESYEERFAQGREPENIDKEFLRLWFRENSDPYNDETLPPAPEQLVVELSRRYIQLYEMITGKEFTIEPCNSIEERITTNLHKAAVTV
ncbi:MAG: phosphoribosylaminoimidazolesuccinocarboxamide synthase [Chitinivibrionales bacterium]|nr:phosphoribosylaminoimidazolesuccinocarboxamide synthase [Chitinivibrionales bacterium]